MTNAIPNVPRELKPCPFCGDSELLGFEPSNEGGWTIVRCRRCGASGSTGRSTSEWEAAAYWNRRDPSPAGVDADHIEDVRAMVADPSPAGVDGLEVATFLHALHMELGQTEQFCSKWKGDPFGVSGVDYSSTYSVTSEPLCRLSDAQAIIDGLRGEVADLRKRAKTAEREAGSALRTYKGLEKVARVVSDNSDQVCGELNVLRQQFDQQAQRIDELEFLLLRVQVSLSLDDTEWGYSGAEKYKLLADIRAALSAGKEGA